MAHSTMDSTPTIIIATIASSTAEELNIVSVYKPGRRLRKPGMNHQAVRAQPVTPPTTKIIISIKWTTLWSVETNSGKQLFKMQ
jgi:hypothetical protein